MTASRPKPAGEPAPSALAIDERLQPTGFIAHAPAVQAGPADAQRQSGGDVLIASEADAAQAEAESAQVGPWHRRRGPTAASGQKKEARAFLVGVTEETTMWISPVVGLQLVHERTLGRASLPCLTNPGNCS